MDWNIGVADRRDIKTMDGFPSMDKWLDIEEWLYQYRRCLRYPIYMILLQLKRSLKMDKSPLGARVSLESLS